MAYKNADSQHLVDVLTDHIGLYHRTVKSASSNTAGASEESFRPRILDWMRRLSVEERQASLTVVDRPWVEILLQMQHHMRTNGESYFFLLPDIPTPAVPCKESRAMSSKPQKSKSVKKRVGNQTLDKMAPSPLLPSLCFRKAKGLLKRLSKQEVGNAMLYRNLRVYSSLDGENINGKPGCLPPLDTLCVSKDLLADLDQFVAAMDAITFGQFLSSPSLGKASSWEELPWLKEMGFYNSRAFVANKLEITLWSAWMNSEGMKLGSKKIAGPLRKELGKIGRFPKGEMHNKTLAISVNRTPVVFANWWNKQDNDMKVNSLKYAVTAAAKIEAIQALSEPRVSSGTQRSYRSKLKGNSISKTVDEAHEFVSHSAHLSDSESEVLDLGDCSDSKFATLSHLTTGLKALKHLALSGFLPGTGEGQVWEQKSMDYLSHQSLGSAESLSCNAFRRVRHVLSRVMRSSIEIDLLGTENGPGHSTCAQMSGSDVKDKRNKCKNLSQSKMVPKSRDSQSKASQAVMFQPTSLKANLDLEPVEAAGEIQKRKKKHGKKKMKAGKGKCLNDNQADRSLPCHVNDGEGQTNNLSKCITSSGLDESKVCNNQVVEDSKAQLVKSMTLQTSCVQTSFDQSMFNVDDVASSSHEMDTQIATQTIIMTEGCDGMVDGQTALVENLQTAISAAENGESAKSMSDSIQEVAEIAGMLNETQQFNWESREKRLSDNIALIGKGEVLTIPSVSAEQGLSSQMSDESFQFSLNEADNCEHTNILQPQISPIIGQPSSYEWPGSVSAYVPAVISELKPTAIEKLHLDVGSNWQQHFQGSLVGLCSQQPAPPAIFSNKSHHSNAKFLDWPSFFQPGYNLTQTVGYPLSLREESTHILLSQACVPVLVGPENCDLSKVSDDIKMDDIVYEVSDYDDSNYFSRVSEEEGGDKHFGEGNHKHTSDYNQIFGGGVMYWNTADYTGTGYSRPPSLSSEDSSWARHEADIYVVLDGSTDDTGGYPTLPIAATSNMISTSPTMASYHANYEQGSKSSTSHTALTMSANDYSGKISSSLASSKVEDEQNSSTIVVPPLNGREGFGNDSQSMPVLRPIVVCRDPNLSRQIPVSDFPRRLESRSPHIPRRRGEIPRWKRPPSPVLRCVPPPPPPPPPPPSPVGEFRKRRGWTTARSGSSSPRHWGLTGWPSKENSDNKELQVEIINGEIVGKNGRTRSIASIPPVHPISGALLFERLMSIPSLTLEQEHPDAAIPMRSTILFKTKPALQSAILKLHKALHEDIELFYKQVAAENIIRKPFVNVAVKKVAHAMQVLWPRSRLKIFGSNATGLALPCSDVDLVVYLPPVRNLEPIKEAGILEGRNGIKETCLQHAARYLADQDWVKVDTLKTIENTAIPIIMLVARVPVHNGSLEGNTLVPHNIKQGCIEEGKSEPQAEYSSDIDDASIIAEESVGPWGGESDRELVRLDISFESPSHTGVRTSELVRELIGQFPAILPLAMVLKQFLMDRSLDHPYTGGLSSYCLVILITRFLQHQQHLGWPFQQSLGSLLMDFLHFFGCVFDPRQMGISIRAGGLYLSRNRGHSIDPLHIEDPLHPLNNVGRNCFRIHQCVKAFADAHACLEKVVMEASFESSHSPHRGGGRTISCFKVLSKILPSLAGF